MTDKVRTSDGRNTIDKYRNWETEAVQNDLQPKRHKFSVLVSNIGRDYNIATCVRNANIFLANSFYYYGRKKFDKRGTVGTHHYEKIIWLPDEKSLDNIPDDYTWVVVDNLPGAVPVDDFDWPEKTLMTFGQECEGTPPEFIKRAKHMVYIKQYGSCRSLNVGTAAGIAMHSYCVQWSENKPNL